MKRNFRGEGDQFRFLGPERPGTPLPPRMGHPDMGQVHPNLGEVHPDVGGQHAQNASKKQKTNVTYEGQMNPLMFGRPRGPMMGPGGMNRPPFEGGHPGLMGPRGSSGPMGGMMGDPRPYIRGSIPMGKVYTTPNGPMRMTYMGPIPIGPDGKMIDTYQEGRRRMLMGPDGPFPIPQAFPSPPSSLPPLMPF